MKNNFFRDSSEGKERNTVDNYCTDKRILLTFQMKLSVQHDQDFLGALEVPWKREKLLNHLWLSLKDPHGRESGHFVGHDLTVFELSLLETSLWFSS